MRFAAVLFGLLLFLPSRLRGGEEPARPAVSLPVSRGAVADAADPKADPPVRVLVTADGRLFLDAAQFRAAHPDYAPFLKHDLVGPLTLGDLAKELVPVVAIVDMERGSAGLPKRREIGKLSASFVHVVVEADRAVPWRHVVWIYSMLFEAYCQDMRYAVAQETAEPNVKNSATSVLRLPPLLEELPTDFVVGLRRKEWVNVVLRSESAKGESPPSAPKYTVAIDGETVGPASKLVEAFRDAKVTKKDHPGAFLNIGMRVPLQGVAKVLDCLREAELDVVAWEPFDFPRPEARVLDKLPDPGSDLLEPDDTDGCGCD